MMLPQDSEKIGDHVRHTRKVNPMTDTVQIPLLKNPSTKSFENLFEVNKCCDDNPWQGKLTEYSKHDQFGAMNWNYSQHTLLNPSKGPHPFPTP